MKIKDLSIVNLYYEIMGDVFDLFLPLTAIFGIALFLYTFRSALTDIVYLALNRWHHTLFIVVCIGVGLFVGAYNSHLSGIMDDYSFHLSLSASKQTEDQRLAETIGQCKNFVETKLDGKPGYEEPSPSLGDVIRIGAKSYWDTCANIFGMNYWKHAAFIRGEEAGPMLCKAYRKDTYRSGNVENWCATVLAPGRKA